MAVSLGWTCHSAVTAVERGLRGRRSDGYRTCPFDAMISNYDGVCRCIAEDFADFTNPAYLELRALDPALGLPEAEGLFHTKYGFYFNHETPYHANLYTTQGWSGGPNHFVSDNFREFQERYDRRIDAFRSIVSDANVEVTFVISIWNRVPVELRDLLRARYPDMRFRIACVHERLVNDYAAHARNMRLPVDSVEATLGRDSVRVHDFAVEDSIVMLD